MMLLCLSQVGAALRCMVLLRCLQPMLCCLPMSHTESRRPPSSMPEAAAAVAAASDLAPAPGAGAAESAGLPRQPLAPLPPWRRLVWSPPCSPQPHLLPGQCQEGSAAAPGLQWLQHCLSHPAAAGCQRLALLLCAQHPGKHLRMLTLYREEEFPHQRGKLTRNEIVSGVVTSGPEQSSF